MQRKTNSSHYLALGDSYTIGESVAAAECWPRQLSARLAMQGNNLGEPQILAQTGWSTDELSDAIDRAVDRTTSELDPDNHPDLTRLTPPYALVSLSIGVNNQYRGWPVEDFTTDFQHLLSRAMSFTDHRRRVFVISIPDWGVSPFAQNEPDRDPAQIAAEIDQYNAAKQAVCAEMAVPFVNITPLSRDLPQFVAGDGLHPSGAQYAWWVFEIEQTVKQMLLGNTAATAPAITKPSAGD